MKRYQPPYRITPPILSLVALISESLAGENMQTINHSPQLRKQNRIKTITGTLAIEGNTLGLEQVSAIIEGKPVRGTQKEIAEARGAIKAYETLTNYQADNIDDLHLAHKLMMQELLPDAGSFRCGEVGIHKGDRIIHVAPQANRVPVLMADLFHWLKQTEEHPLISSCVFHYEFEFIHPFSDGNGRIGRLWQTLILGQWRELFYSLPIESAIKNSQQDYYEALATSDKTADSTVFIEFMLKMILDAISFTPQVNPQVTPQVERLLQVLSGEMARDELQELLGLQDRKSFRKNYLKPALEKGLIEMTIPEKPNSRMQKYRLTNILLY